MRLALITATVLLATPALAAADGAAKPAKPAKEKKICRTTEITGTRFGGSTVCKTIAEWNADSQRARNEMEQRQRADYNASEVNGAGEPR